MTDSETVSARARRSSSTTSATPVRPPSARQPSPDGPASFVGQHLPGTLVRRPPLTLPDPRLARIGERGARVFELALAKTLLHGDDPRRYPLPAHGGAIERRIDRVLSDLPRAAVRKLRKHYGAAVEGSAADRRERFGDLAKLDLASEVPVLDQLRRLPVPAELRMTALEVERAAERLRPSFLPTGRLSPRQAAEPVALIPRLRRIECVRESRELGRDEISVAALVVDDLGNAEGLDPIDFGKLKTGDVVDLTVAPREVFRFDLAGGDFPKAFAVSYFVIEEDPISLATLLTLIGLAGLALVTAGMIVLVAAPAALALSVVLAGTGILMTGVAGAVGYNFKVLPPPPELLVEFPDRGQVTFLDENGEKSAVSIPETLGFSVSGGRYELTTDFLLV